MIASKKFNAMKANIGEKSRPPIGGKIFLNGKKRGSDSWKTNLTAGWLFCGEIQLKIIPANML
jgi:hypothetical protein